MQDLEATIVRDDALGLKQHPEHPGGARACATCLEPAVAYKGLAPLIGRRVKVDLIREHWGEILHLVASLQAGTVPPSDMLKRLAAFQRQNQLDLALQELGRIERTLFTIDWRASAALRQRCQPEQERTAPLPGPGDLHL